MPKVATSSHCRSAPSIRGTKRKANTIPRIEPLALPPLQASPSFLEDDRIAARKELEAQASANEDILENGPIEYRIGSDGEIVSVRPANRGNHGGGQLFHNFNMLPKIPLLPFMRPGGEKTHGNFYTRFKTSSAALSVQSGFRPILQSAIQPSVKARQVLQRQLSRSSSFCTNASSDNMSQGTEGTPGTLRTQNRMVNTSATPSGPVLAAATRYNPYDVRQRQRREAEPQSPAAVGEPRRHGTRHTPHAKRKVLGEISLDEPSPSNARSEPSTSGPSAVTEGPGIRRKVFGEIPLDSPSLRNARAGSSMVSVATAKKREAVMYALERTHNIRIPSFGTEPFKVAHPIVSKLWMMSREPPNARWKGKERASLRTLEEDEQTVDNTKQQVELGSGLKMMLGEGSGSVIMQEIRPGGWTYFRVLEPDDWLARLILHRANEVLIKDLREEFGPAQFIFRDCGCPTYSRTSYGWTVSTYPGYNIEWKWIKSTTGRSMQLVDLDGEWEEVEKRRMERKGVPPVWPK